MLSKYQAVHYKIMLWANYILDREQVSYGNSAWLGNPMKRDEKKKARLGQLAIIETHWYLYYLSRNLEYVGRGFKTEEEAEKAARSVAREELRKTLELFDLTRPTKVTQSRSVQNILIDVELDREIAQITRIMRRLADERVELIKVADVCYIKSSSENRKKQADELNIPQSTLQRQLRELWSYVSAGLGKKNSNLLAA